MSNRRDPYLQMQFYHSVYGETYFCQTVPIVRQWIFQLLHIQGLVATSHEAAGR